jgi:hypothetical protein
VKKCGKVSVGEAKLSTLQATVQGNFGGLPDIRYYDNIYLIGCIYGETQLSNTRKIPSKDEGMIVLSG